MFIKVVFPEPDGPMIATYSPSSIEKSTFFNEMKEALENPGYEKEGIRLNTDASSIPTVLQQVFRTLESSTLTR